MLSIQAVRGLPRLRAPGIVPCIISFSRQLPCFLIVWPQYASFIALTVSNSSLFTPALLRTHSFFFFAVPNSMLRYYTSTHTHTFNGPFSGTTRVSRYQKGKTNLDFTEARDSEWQWHQLGHTQVCTSLQTDNHASTPPLSFLQAGCPSCPSFKALKAIHYTYNTILHINFT